MTANADKALRVIANTPGKWGGRIIRMSQLLGPQMADIRQAAMSALVGAKVPKAKAGLYALWAELFKQCEISGGDCLAVREDALDKLLQERAI